jgi:L-alanine-DL-glutamate epimerase-like enolase superfamily enzyme
MEAEPRVSKALRVRVERWPIRGEFTISRGSKREAIVVVAEIEAGGTIGRGECVPYARYGESVDDVAATIEGYATALADGLTRSELQALLPSGAARNAIDCALWELEAKLAGKSVPELAGFPALAPVLTAFTISLASPEEMAAQAKEAAYYPLLKLKLGGDGNEDRLAAVRQAVPQTRLIADANEAWPEDNIETLLQAARLARVELIEQPLPAGADDVLAEIVRQVPICADESVHDRASLAPIASRYDAVNIKLDKTGGLTEALAVVAEARSRGLKVMIGSMVATSLGMAPALLLAQSADWVDLDGPLLLARDREPGLIYDGGMVRPIPGVWG